MIRKSIAKSFTKFETCTIGSELRQVNKAVGIILTLCTFSFHTFIAPFWPEKREMTVTSFLQSSFSYFFLKIGEWLPYDMKSISVIQQYESVISIQIPLPLEPLSQFFVQHFFSDCFVRLHNRHQAQVGGESQKIMRQTRQPLPWLKTAWQVHGLWPAKKDLLIMANAVSPIVETDGWRCGYPRKGTLNCLQDWVEWVVRGGDIWAGS